MLVAIYKFPSIIASALNALLVPDGRIIRAEGANLVVIIESSIPAAKIVLSQFLNRAFDQFGQVRWPLHVHAKVIDSVSFTLRSYCDDTHLTKKLFLA